VADRQRTTDNGQPDFRALLADRQSLFPILAKCIYFNHAAVGPLPATTAEAMARHAADQRDFGALHWREWYAEHDRLRAAAARLIGADAGEISILKNTSEGLAFVAEGFAWERGDNVVTTDLEFPSNYTPWKHLERRGVECRVVRNVAGCVAPEQIEPSIDARTRIVTISTVAFHNGFAADVEAIGELCARHGVLFCLDAIQSLGVIPVDVKKARVSFLAADGHKWLLGPEGTAVFFCAAEQRQRLDVVESGWTNIRKRASFIEMPVEFAESGRRFEGGSLNTNGAYGLRASLDLIESIGVERIGAEAIRLATRLADGAEGIGCRIGTPRPIRSAIVGVYPPPVESARVRKITGAELSATSSPGVVLSTLHAWLEREGVVCAPREGMLRFSPHFYNGDEQVDRVVELLGSLVR
jgi:cysteine desulfurase/selenocysteine lyase